MFDIDNAAAELPVVQPKFDPKEERKAQVLAWVNEMRANLFALAPLTELPRGYRGMPKACVIARALDSRVVAKSKGLFTLPNYRKECAYPAHVREFIEAFDLGRYPELEEGVTVPNAPVWLAPASVGWVLKT